MYPKYHSCPICSQISVKVYSFLGLLIHVHSIVNVAYGLPGNSIYFNNNQDYFNLKAVVYGFVLAMFNVSVCDDVPQLDQHMLLGELRCTF